jgi:protein-arginine kinase activator protein McsA
MKQAAEKEEFERAAQLRDQIRQLEAEQTEGKESA